VAREEAGATELPTVYIRSIRETQEGIDKESTERGGREEF
jgi:hypothetical protein